MDTNGVDQANYTRKKKTRRNKHAPYMQVDIKRKSDACVIGNGLSRLVFDLDEIHDVYTTYGCNALYRDFMPDYLISVDQHMVGEILDKKVHYKTNFYTQYSQKCTHRMNSGEPINYITQDRYMGDSGTAAIRLAAQNGHKTIYLIGFDYTGHTTKIENVYHGTQNYSKGPITMSCEYLLRQFESRLNHHVQTYSDTKFIHVRHGNNLICKQKNFTTISQEQFKYTLGENE